MVHCVIPPNPWSYACLFNLRSCSRQTTVAAVFVGQAHPVLCPLLTSLEDNNILVNPPTRAVLLTVMLRGYPVLCTACASASALLAASW